MFKQTQRSFVGGMLDKELMGRTDLTKYFEGACKLENFLVRRQGNISKRRGTELVADLDNLFGDGSYISDIRSIPFASTDTSVGYTLLFVESSTGLSRCYVCCKDGILVEKTTTPTGGSPSVSYEWRRYAYNPPEEAEGETITYSPYSLAIPYSGGDFEKIGYFQSGDTLFLAHKLYPFASVTHPDDFVFSYNVLDFETLGQESLPDTPIITSITPSSEFSGSTGSTRTIEYRVTAVSNGLESYPSQPYSISYRTPWPENGTMSITIAEQTPRPEYYNVYKKQDSTWGLVGTTSTGEFKVTTLPVTITGLTQDFATSWFKVYSSGSNDRAVSGSTRLASTAAKQWYNYGGRCYVAGSGAFTIDYGTNGCNLDVVHLGVSASMYFGCYGSVKSCRVYCMFLATRTRRVKAVVTFTDGSTKTIEGALHQQSDIYDNTVWVDPYNPGSAITNKVRSFGDSLYIDFEVQGRDVAQSSKKRTRSIQFLGYTDAEMTTLASGSIAGDSAAVNYGFPGWPTITGNPFVIHGIYASAYGATTSNTFVDEYVTPDASIAPPNIEPHFNSPGQYPSCVCMYNQRLALASSLDQPFTYWFSCIGDLYNFNTHDSIREDDALEATLPATKYPNINHMVLNRDLILFCDNGEWVVQPVAGNTLTYKTLSAKVQSQIGCSKDLVPIVVGNDIIFINATNETMHAIRYNYASDGYEDMDLSVLSQNLFRANPIVSMAYKKDPDSTILCVTADGSIAALVYMREHEVVAWSHITLGGGMKAISCCADESITDGTTNVFVVAQEDFGTYLGYSLLRVKEDSPFSGIASAVTMDRVERVEIAANATPHYVPQGKVAVNLATGETVRAGERLPSGATYAIGYPFTAELVTIRPEPSPQETIQFEIKNAKSVEVRTLHGSSYAIRAFAAPDRIPFTAVEAEPTFGADGAIALDASDHKTAIQGANSGDGRIRLKHEGVWPLSILQLSVNYEIQPLSNSAG